MHGMLLWGMDDDGDDDMCVCVRLSERTCRGRVYVMHGRCRRRRQCCRCMQYMCIVFIFNGKHLAMSPINSQHKLQMLV